MNNPSQTRHSPRIFKIQPSYPIPAPEITPKKQYQDLKPHHADQLSTLQKHILFESDIKPQTVRKDKKKPKRPWTPEEDVLLKELVHSKGPKEWAFISSYFNERCGKQCRERWHNHLRNGIKKGDWSYEEQWLLFLGVHSYGKRWSLISKYLEGRTENTLKNHWNCKMKPKKENLSRKLLRVLGMNSNRFNSKQEALLMKMIKDKSLREEQCLQNESENIQRMMRLFKGVIDRFLEEKRRIYGQYEAKNQEVKVEEQVSMELSMGQEYQKQSVHKEQRPIQMKMEMEAIENELYYQTHTFGMINDFGSDSNQLININMEGLIKEVSQMSDNDEYDDEREEEYDMSDSTERNGESENEEDRFGSPLRRNIFAGINLDESSKKKLFDSDKKQIQNQPPSLNN